MLGHEDELATFFSPFGSRMGSVHSPLPSRDMEHHHQHHSKGSNKANRSKSIEMGHLESSPNMHRSASFAMSAHDDDRDLMMVENLLEFYFAILDHAFDCLKTLEEIIDNTEEMIDIELDTARNRLIKLEIMLTGCTFTFTIYGKSLCPSASRSRNGV